MSKKPDKRRGAATSDDPPQSQPRNTPSPIECKATWLDVNAPLYFPLCELAADWKTLKAEHDPLSDRVANSNDPPESDQDDLLALFDKQDDLVRRVEKLLKVPPKFVSCLYIKAALLGIFSVFGERNWKPDGDHFERGGRHPSNDSLAAAAFQLVKHLEPDTETPPDTVGRMILIINASLF